MVTTGNLFVALAAIGKRARQFFFLTVFLLLLSAPLSAQDIVWPTELSTDKGEITLYQPQIDSFEENILEGRMALSYTEANNSPLFGALWFKATLHTDLDSRTATLSKLTIPELRFSDMEDSVSLQEIKDHIIQEVQRLNPVISIDSIVAELSHDKGSGGVDLQLKNTPPDIYFRDKPTLLVTIDGKPIWMDVEDGRLEAVRNTPFFIVREKETSSYYLNGGGFWYVSAAISNGWKVTDQVPELVRQFAEKNKLQDVEITVTEDKAPDLLVVTNPSELIVVNGKAEYTPIKGTQLLFVENTESDLLFYLPSQTYYLLLSGRWYASKLLQGNDWQFVEPTEIPADFAKIPEESDRADVRVSVPGTPEAKDALLSQLIPQTVVVDRKTATVVVRYDGKPVFQAIPGTAVSYALNTSQAVLEINGVYYAVVDGVWYIAVTADGPWQVATERPVEVDSLPVDSPVYNVKYVYIYDYTPDVVYMGYLPGYTYSYISSGLVVYGSGFDYTPWYRSYYYPRPLTWGFGVRYNSSIGWGFSVDYSFGWINWGYHPFPRYWGSRGYYPGLGRRTAYDGGYHRGYDRGTRNRHGVDQPQNYYNNIYRNSNRPGIMTRQWDKQTNRSINSKQIRPNNHYVDRNGNVYRKDGTNWSRENNPAIQQRGIHSGGKLSDPAIQQRGIHSGGKLSDPAIQQRGIHSREQLSDPAIQQRGIHSGGKLSVPAIQQRGIHSREQLSDPAIQQRGINSGGKLSDPAIQQRGIHSREQLSDPVIQQRGIHSGGKLSDPAIQQRGIHSGEQLSDPVIQQRGIHSGEKLLEERAWNVQKKDNKTDAVERRPSSSNQQLQRSESNRIRGNNSYRNSQGNRPPSVDRPMKGGGGHH